MNVFCLLPRVSISSRVTSSARLSIARFSVARTMATKMNGDLNNTAAERARAEIITDQAYRSLSFAILASEDEDSIRRSYRPFLLDEASQKNDWIARLELSTVLKMVDLQVLRNGGDRLKVLVLHGSMRKR
jgi:arsenic resistance protein ArsH